MNRGWEREGSNPKMYALCLGKVSPALRLAALRKQLRGNQETFQFYGQLVLPVGCEKTKV